MSVSGQVEMVDCYVAALADVFECDGASDACGAAGYGGGFGEEEIMWWHFGGGLVCVFVCSGGERRVAGGVGLYVYCFDCFVVTRGKDWILRFERGNNRVVLLV